MRKRSRVRPATSVVPPIGKRLNRVISQRELRRPRAVPDYARRDLKRRSGPAARIGVRVAGVRMFRPAVGEDLKCKLTNRHGEHVSITARPTFSRHRKIAVLE